MRSAGERVVGAVTSVGQGIEGYLDGHPAAQAVVTRGQRAVAGGAKIVADGASKTAAALPDGLTDWTGAAFASMRRTVGRLSRAGLSSKRLVSAHKRRGHEVISLADIRKLDLEQVDKVGLRGASWYYPASAAVSGGAAGLVISGGQLVTAASAGAAAAPSGAAVAGAFAGDIAVVLALASRAVGHVSLVHGYDPEDPAEKLFILSVVNAGSAMSATAKAAAMADISRLTQALVRGRTWAVLNESIVAQLSGQFAKRFGIRLTKQGLGKVVPIAGILVGGTFNWTTLEAITDAAVLAYRRRFLIEKYPHLADEEVPVSTPGEDSDAVDETDEVISVLDELQDVGGPDLD